jgi:hypothetical protein
MTLNIQTVLIGGLILLAIFGTSCVVWTQPMGRGSRIFLLCLILILGAGGIIYARAVGWLG